MCNVIQTGLLYKQRPPGKMGNVRNEVFWLIIWLVSHHYVFVLPAAVRFVLFISCLFESLFTRFAGWVHNMLQQRGMTNKWACFLSESGRQNGLFACDINAPTIWLARCQTALTCRARDYSHSYLDIWLKLKGAWTSRVLFARLWVYIPNPKLYRVSYQVMDVVLQYMRGNTCSLFPCCICGLNPHMTQEGST